MNRLIRDHFSAVVWEQGAAYAEERRVKNIQCTQTPASSIYSADVTGSRRLPYVVEVRLVLQAHFSSFDSKCTCRAQRDCKHAAALLYVLEKKHVLPNDAPIVEELKEPDVFVDMPWYAQLSPTHNQQWFDFEIGVEIEGKKVNILPALLELIHAHKDVLQQNQTVIVSVPEIGNVQLSSERLSSILKTVSELYDTHTLNRQHRLVLNTQRAAFLLEMQQALNITQTRWLGFDAITQLAQVLQQAEFKMVPIPPGFKGELRHYQQEGLNWLQFLREYQLGGVLADDMGLGKTVQTLAHLQCEKETGRLSNPCLIVCPTSLLYNWQQEIQRFTPGLKSLLFYGGDRARFLGKFDQFDIIISSYTVVLQDRDFFKQQPFHYLIVDEAQMIKNPRAQTSLVMQQLNAQYRLCLTGTPMENHLGDLWSLFHFLMPGFLGTQRQFNTVFRIPIEKRNDAQMREALTKRTQPFLLRRTKAQVAQELPSKVMMIQPIELSSAQRDLYESIRLAMEDRVKSAIARDGFASSQIIILDALLKLRQVCCDPRVMRLSQGALIGDPAKLTWLLDTLPNLLEDGRRILLFSTFKSVLMNIAKTLDEQQIPYVMLTGDTRDRQTPIQAFQNKQVPLFLISLKAGGVGLNLTAADTVIHYDPWWNPAAEAQATDRAHRIGQDKTVFVYKLITKNTVEEKMLQLQEKKADLLAGILANATGSVGLDVQEVFNLLQ